jgi:hypothetical protein
MTPPTGTPKGLRSPTFWPQVICCMCKASNQCYDWLAILYRWITRSQCNRALSAQGYVTRVFAKNDLPELEHT